MLAIGLCTGVLYLLITAGVTLHFWDKGELLPRSGWWRRAADAWRTRGQVTQGPRFSEDPQYAQPVREDEAA